MNNLWKKFLARAALARHEHRQVNGSHLHGTRYGLHERGRIAHDAKPLPGTLYLRRIVESLKFHITILYNVSGNVPFRHTPYKDWSI